MPAPDTASPDPTCPMQAAGSSPGRLSWGEVLPFYLAGAVLAVFAAAGVALGLEIWPRGEVVSNVVRRWAFGAGLGLVVVSVVSFVWPRVFAVRLRQVARLAEVLTEVSQRVADLEVVRRELYRCRSAVENVAQLHQTEREHFVEHRRFLLEHVNLADDLHQARLESAGARKQLDRWCEAAAAYFAQFERLLDTHDTLGNETRRMVAKLLDGFVRSIAPLGVQLIRPEPNQAFDARIHRAVGEEETAAVAAGHVLTCRRWGLQYGTDIKRQAEVVVAKKPISTQAPPKTTAVNDDETVGPRDDTIG